MHQNEYPRDYFLEIEGDEYRIGRLTLNKYENQFNVEIDIVQKESKKIWSHVGRLYDFDDEQEAIDNAVYYLARFLKNPKISLS